MLNKDLLPLYIVVGVIAVFVIWMLLKPKPRKNVKDIIYVRFSDEWISVTHGNTIHEDEPLVLLNDEKAEHQVGRAAQKAFNDKKDKEKKADEAKKKKEEDERVQKNVSEALEKEGVKATEEVAEKPVEESNEAPKEEKKEEKKEAPKPDALIFNPLTPDKRKTDNKDQILKLCQHLVYKFEDKEKNKPSIDNLIFHTMKPQRERADFVSEDGEFINWLSKELNAKYCYFIKGKQMTQAELKDFANFPEIKKKYQEQDQNIYWVDEIKYDKPRFTLALILKALGILPIFDKVFTILRFK